MCLISSWFPPFSSSLLPHFFFLLSVTLVALWYVNLARRNSISQYAPSLGDRNEAAVICSSHMLLLIRWFTLSWSSSWPAMALSSSGSSFTFSDSWLLFRSKTKGLCRIPLKPRSDARITVSVHCYGVLAHSYGHQLTSNLPFLIACPVDFKLQPQVQRQQPYRDCLTSPYGCVSQVPVTNPLLLPLWLNFNRSGHLLWPWWHWQGHLQSPQW